MEKKFPNFINDNKKDKKLKQKIICENIREEKKKILFNREEFVEELLNKIPKNYTKKNSYATIEEKILIKEIYEKVKTENIGNPIKRVAYYFSRSESFINKYIRIDVNEFDKKVEEKKINEIIPEEIQIEIKNYIESSLKSGKCVWSSDILNHLTELEYTEEINKKKMIKILHLLGYEYDKLEQQNLSFELNKKVIMEKRENFTKLLLENSIKSYNCTNNIMHECGIIKCNLQRDIVFLDESYINRNHVREIGWHFSTQKLIKPGGVGERICIIAAISPNVGLLYDKKLDIKKELKKSYKCGSVMYFKCQNSNEDFHSNFNSVTFLKYLKENLIPYLAPNSLVVMDNAPYHSELEEDSIKYYNANKHELEQYIKKVKPELLNKEKKYKLTELKEIAKHNWHEIKPKTKVESLLESFGHQCCYLPPYHPELNPIEYV